MSRICLYFRQEPAQDRWLPGDRFIRPLVRRIVRGTPRVSGPTKVLTNLCLGLARLALPYEVNLPFEQLRDGDRIGVIGGVGRYALRGYERSNPIVAGPGLMSHPSEWPTLCSDYPVATYLQACEWCNNVYQPFFGERCRVWPVGIDTQVWAPVPANEKSVDFLIYDKILWRREDMVPRLLGHIGNDLAGRSLSFRLLRYGEYTERQYQEELRACRAMIFLCEHESQGIAYQECLSSGVPILAWDQGRWLDPNRERWRQADVRATSVPYFDARCGVRFRDIEEFPEKLAEFLALQRAGAFAPRDYILENLTLEKCAEDFVRILDDAQRAPKPAR